MRFITHMLSAVAGALVGGYLCLIFASFTSLVWQENLKLNVSNDLRKEGALSARSTDWQRVMVKFESARRLDERVKPGTWDLWYPLTSWRLVREVRYPDDTFATIDYAVEAYALKKQGRLDEAEKIYAQIIKNHPETSRTSLEAIAQQALSSFSPSSTNKP